MALRGVAPLTNRQWEKLEELMERGPSEQQIKIVEEIQKMKHIKIEF